MQRILKTDRLILRPATLLDAGAIFGAMEYDISKWLTRVPHPYSITDAQDWLSSLRFECGSYVWAITRAGEVIGMIGLDPTLGYWVAKEHRGQGYVSEAAHAVLTAYFTILLQSRHTAVILLKTNAPRECCPVWAIRPWANQLPRCQRHAKANCPCNAWF